MQAGGMEVQEVLPLRGGELELLALQSALGSSDGHASSCAQADQVGVELRDHTEHVGRQPAYWVNRVVGAAAETERNAIPPQLLEWLLSGIVCGEEETFYWLVEEAGDAKRQRERGIVLSSLEGDDGLTRDVQTLG
jgi:hypothetical protein